MKSIAHLIAVAFLLILSQSQALSLHKHHKHATHNKHTSHDSHQVQQAIMQTSTSTQ
jgi:hypothetical protein